LRDPGADISGMIHTARDAARLERAAERRFTWRTRLWPLAGLIAATVPVAGVFTLTRIFFVRDLTLAFRSRFLFLRHSVFAGTFPQWDPYPANGQSAVNDALYQLFHLPSLLVRLALPEIVAFNLWVALPIPLAALGAYLFLRRHVSAPAASFGAVAFAAAGPIVSTTNFPNMSWSVAAVPYVFWVLERAKARPVAVEGILLAAIVACQALAGEPVTLAATLAIASSYVVFTDAGWRNPRLLAVSAAGLIAGVLLAAVQFVPLAAASRVSVRGLMRGDDTWSFHPLTLFELIVPHFFGDYFTSHLRQLVWMVALNSHREPFYYTMYVGVPTVLLAAIAAMSRRRHTLFWTAVIAACLFASFGDYTPVYPALEAAAPPLKSFRFPVKYMSLATFGIAVLASFTIQWLPDRDVPLGALRRVAIAAAAAGVAAYLFIAWLLVAPAVPLQLFFKLAVWAKVPFPLQGAEYLIFRARPLLTALFLKLVCAAFLVWIAGSGRRERRTALIVLVAFTVVDLLAANASINPTIPAAWMEAPAWTHQVDRSAHQRVYIGGRLFGEIDARDIDAPKYAAGFDQLTDMERRYVTVNELMFHTSGSQIRESISYDLPVLWPIAYAQMLTRFQQATREERLRVVTRSGGRYVVLPTPPYSGARPLATLRGVEQSKLYDLNPSARRAYIVPDALLGPSVAWQIEGLFQSRFDPSAGVLVSEPPPPASGIPGSATSQSAAFVEDAINRVVIRATLPRDGYLVLLDSYDPSWRVTVDGAEAPLMRANGLFRAVHLTRGEHLVAFTYRPRTLYTGAAITAITAFGLLLWWVLDRRRSRAPLQTV
jgi:hypothetical protein